MSCLLRELVRRPSSSSSSSSTRLIATLSRQNPTHHSPPLSLLHQQILSQTKFDQGGVLNPSNIAFVAMDEVPHFSKLQAYPSFSFGIVLDPILQSGLVPYHETDHPGMMWADSVKKKMNKHKHKYKKLRKRLRRKTKT